MCNTTANCVLILISSLLFIILPSSSTIAAAATSYNVISFGAKRDLKTDSTNSFLQAWAAACRSVKPATLYVPKGQYMIKQVVFEGPCKNRVIMQIDGTLVAPKNLWELASSRNWMLFDSINRVSINGGTLNGRGPAYWACKNAGQKCPPGAMSIAFNNAKNVVIKGLTSVNSQIAHISINGCDNIKIKHLTIIAPENSPNTDGIDINMSTGVTITDSTIKTGDDCISIGPGTKELLIQRVKCGPGHGISIGSLARNVNEAGVQDITVRDVTFTGSENGVRIKTWARPSNGFVRNVLYQNIVMNNVQNPIIIDQTYCPSSQGCPNQHSGIKISGVIYQNIRGTSATPVAIDFDCSPSNPCQGIQLHNVKLTHLKTPAKSTCMYVLGKVSGFVLPGSCL